MSSLARNTVIYGVGVVLSRAVSFLMLPIYTRFLSPGDYGILTLLQMTTDVTAILLSAGTTAGVLRFYFKSEDQRDRHTVIDTALTLLAGLNGIGAVLLVIAAPWLATMIFKGEAGPGLIRITAGIFFLDSFVIVPLLFAQAQERAKLFVGANAAKLVLQLTLNLLFLVVFEWGVRGVLLGALVSNLIIGTALTAWTLRQTGYHLSRKVFRELRRFGIPYQFVTAGTFILAFGDRFFLQASHGLQVVGLYGLAYQFGFVLLSLGELPILQAWNPQRFRAVTQPREVRDAGYAEGFLLLNLTMISLAVGISVFIRPFLTIMSDPAFHPAATYVPVILAAYVMHGWTDVVQFGIDVSEQTKYATLGTWISVVTIVILYIVLIPPFGAMGAAVATVGGFAVRFTSYYVFAQRLWPIAYHWPPHVRLVLIAIAVVLLNLAVHPEGFLRQSAVGTAFSAVYAATVWLVVLGRVQRRRAVRIFKGLLRTVRATLAH